MKLKNFLLAAITALPVWLMASCTPAHEKPGQKKPVPTNSLPLLIDSLPARLRFLDTEYRHLPNQFNVAARDGTMVCNITLHSMTPFADTLLVKPLR